MSDSDLSITSRLSRVESTVALFPSLSAVSSLASWTCQPSANEPVLVADGARRSWKEFLLGRARCSGRKASHRPILENQCVECCVEKDLSKYQLASVPGLHHHGQSCVEKKKTTTSSILRARLKQQSVPVECLPVQCEDALANALYHFHSIVANLVVVSRSLQTVFFM